MKILRNIFLLILMLGATSPLYADLYVLTKSGMVARSENNGASWNWVGQIGVSDATAMANDAVSRLYVITESGDLAYSQDEGITWTFIGSIGQIGASGIEFDNLDNLYVVTQSGDVFKSTNYGVSFNLISSVGASDVVGIAGRGDSLYVVTRSGDLARSTNQGVSWSILSNMGASDVSGITATTSGIYVVTDAGDVAKSINGSNWDFIGTVNQLTISEITVRSDDNLFVTTHAGEVAMSSDGTSWAWQGTANQVWVTGILCTPMRCDVNNDAQLDICDIVRMENIILGRPPLPTPYELWAADCNNDGEIDVGDIVCCIYKILGYGCPITEKVNTELESSELSITETNIFQGEWVDVAIEINNSIPVAGVQLALDYDTQSLTVGELKTSERSHGFEIAFETNSGQLIILLYSSSGDAIAAGSGQVITISVKVSPNAANTLLHLKQAIFASKDGSPIPVTMESKTVAIASPSNAYALLQLYPNPCYSGTDIRYQLTRASKVSIKIYNSTGQLVKTLVDECPQPGYYRVHWNGSDDSSKPVAAGIYLCRMQVHTGLKTGEFTYTRTIILLR
jgi:hypothetical protein